MKKKANPIIDMETRNLNCLKLRQQWTTAETKEGGNKSKQNPRLIIGNTNTSSNERQQATDHQKEIYPDPIFGR